jgi:hypothetical protein
MKFLGISSLVFAALAAQAGTASADNISVRLNFKQEAAGLSFKAVHATRGDFAISPGLGANAKLPKWRVVAKNAQGRIVHEVFVINGSNRHVEVFNPNTGAIEHSKFIAQPRGAFEVSLPFDADIASIEVHPRASANEATVAAAPLATFSRAALEQVVSASPQTVTTGAVPTGTTVVNSGPSKKRMDYVLVGDGYTAAEMGKWRTDAKKVIDGMLADPLFAANRDKINIHRVDIASNESGVDEPDINSYRDTAMDGTFNCGNVLRSLCVDDDKAYAIVRQVMTPDRRDIIIVVSNTARYGGSGGAVAALSMNSEAVEAALHELGHTAFGLGDEYSHGECWDGYEPDHANLSMESTRAVKWGGLIAATTPVPTLPGQVPNGTVGAFEGGNYCVSGMFRPTEDSKMRSLGQPWHAVNERAAQEAFARYQTRIVREVTQTGTLEEGGWGAPIPESYTDFDAGPGTFKFKMTGTPGTNFNLMLLKLDADGNYNLVDYSSGISSKEVINYEGTAGFYSAYVEQVEGGGSGSYSVTYSIPPK